MALLKTSTRQSKTQYSCYYESVFGPLLLVCEEDALTGIWFDKKASFDPSTITEATLKEDHPILVAAKKWLDAYFQEKKDLPRSFPIKPKGTPFQQLVWEQLKEIPFGAVTTYGDIAKKIAKQLGKQTMSSQAIGQALTKNPLPILLPCHRVIAANHALTGYGGGIEKKAWLLEHEQKR